MSQDRSARNFLLITLAIGFVSAALGFMLYISPPGFLKEVDLRFGDFRFKLRERLSPIKPPQDIVIIAIDEKSINQLGRWPWSRTVLAQFTDKLAEYAPKTVGFDIVFSESESEEADSALIEAMRKSGNITLGYFFRDSSTQETPKEALAQINRSNIKLIKFLDESEPDTIREFSSIETNIPSIGAAAKGFGFFNAFPDQDGIFRRTQFFIKHGENIYPSLSLESVRRYLKGQILLMLASYGIEEIMINERAIPSDERSQFLLNFYGRSGSFATYPIVDVLNGALPPEALRDKLVFIGPTEIGIYDVRATPLDPTFPGVEIHATVAGNILDGRFLIQNNLTKAVDMVLTVLLPILLSVGLFFTKRNVSGLALFLGLASLSLAGNYLAFEKSNFLLSAVFPVLSLVFAFVGFEGYRNIIIESRGRYLRKAFTSYISPEVVALIMSDPNKLKLGGELKTVSILFSDIRGFTTLSEKLSPEMLVSLLNEYLSPMTKIVLDERGTLDKYIGDAVMAIFGAPVDLPDHQKRICAAALRMIERLKELNPAWEKMGFPSIAIGVGINTGEAIVGNMGADIRFQYTAIGDTVNLASRLEGLNKYYDTQIIVSKTTLEGFDHSDLLLREIDLVQVKGKDKPVAIFELMSGEPAPEDKRELASAFSEAVCLYREREFHEALEKFTEILEKFPHDKPSQLYQERCEGFIIAPPDVDWDGVYVAKEK
ncbi:MAG: CHASE2 domain-containing protein [Deltaproteobacteria bacterium]